MRILRALTGVAVAGAAAAVLTPTASANAMNPCDYGDPPDYCYDRPPPTTAPTPAAPTNLVLSSVLQPQVTLRWSDNSTNETGWRIQRDMVVGNSSTTTWFRPGSAATASAP